MLEGLEGAVLLEDVVLLELGFEVSKSRKGGKILRARATGSLLCLSLTSSCITCKCTKCETVSPRNV